MATITKQGRELRYQLNDRFLECTYEEYATLAETCSLIARHAKTYRRLAEIQCGDGIHSGEWVNANWDWLEKRDQQVENRLLALANELPNGVRMELQGDPRGYLVRLIVTDESGVERTVGVD
jgi:hypothetical protein